MNGPLEKLTIGVVSYNSAEFLEPCLRSVLNESSPLGARLVVVDNGSRDGSAALVRERFPSVRLFAEGGNGGYGSGCNKVFEASDEDHVLLLNADVELVAGCLPPLLRFLSDHPRAGIVGCRLLETDGRVQPSRSAFPSIRSYLAEAFFLDRILGVTRTRAVGSGGGDAVDRAQQTDVVLGAFLLVRRDAIRAVGGMDPRFFMYSEETDFCYRAMKAGWETWYVPSGSAVHHGGKSVESVQAEMFVENHKSKVLFMRIHHGRLRAAGARAALCLGALLRLCLWTFLLSGAALFRAPGKRKALDRVRMFAAVSAWHFDLRARSRLLGAG